MRRHAAFRKAESLLYRLVLRKAQNVFELIIKGGILNSMSRKQTAVVAFRQELDRHLCAVFNQRGAAHGITTPFISAINQIR
jgi:hypothetical protein